MSARRRMSSFPPSDGDESAIVLEKIHSMCKIEIGIGDEEHPERLRTPGSEEIPSSSSLLSPFKLLRRGTGGFFPSSKSKKSRWKSSADIPASLAPPLLLVPPSPDLAAPAPTETPPPPPPAAEESKKASSSSSSAAFLRPGFPLMSRRGSSPLEAELSAYRKTCVDGEAQRNVVVFPRRKLEDVPGIFIPHRASKNDGGPHFLGVRSSKDDDRRRHSISDPILVQRQLGRLPALLPRSPYLVEPVLARYSFYV